MSILIGKGNRFASGHNPAGWLPGLPEPLIVDTARPVPPDAFRGLMTGPEASIIHEAPTSAAVDGSRVDLRDLSPFILRVEPPAILGEASAGGHYLDEVQKKPNLGELFSSAYVASSAFVHARASLLNADYVKSEMHYGATATETISRASVGGGKKDDQSKINVPLNGKGSPGRIGAPAIADVWTAVDIASQLRAVASTPPLVLLINPTTMTKNFTKIQQFTERTRFGYIFQAWGEEQPTMSITARCGAFISGGRGVQWAGRRDSASWQNLVGAFHFYRNNGYIYDTVGRSNAHLMVGALSIHYDGWIHYGHMQSFNFAFNEQNMHGGVEFSMEFTVSAMVDTTSQSSFVTPLSSPNGSRFGTSGGGSSPKGLGINLFEGTVDVVSADPPVVPASGAGAVSPDHGASLMTAAVSTSSAGRQTASTGTGAFSSTPDRARSVPEGGRAVPFRTGGHA